MLELSYDFKQRLSEMCERRTKIYKNSRRLLDSFSRFRNATISEIPLEYIIWRQQNNTVVCRVFITANEIFYDYTFINTHGCKRYGPWNMHSGDLVV
jgi:hypothetical protein